MMHISSSINAFIVIFLLFLELRQSSSAIRHNAFRTMCKYLTQALQNWEKSFYYLVKMSYYHTVLFNVTGEFFIMCHKSKKILLVLSNTVSTDISWLQAKVFLTETQTIFNNIHDFIICLLYTINYCVLYIYL